MCHVDRAYPSAIAKIGAIVGALALCGPSGCQSGGEEAPGMTGDSGAATDSSQELDSGAGTDSDGRPDSRDSCSGAACAGGAAYVMASRAFNLCASVGPSGPASEKCDAASAAPRWRSIDTAAPGRYALQNQGADLCLQSVGSTLKAAPCRPTDASLWWSFEAIAGDNNNHWIVQNQDGLCLSNETLEGQSGALTLATCNKAHWTQQWKKLGPQTDANGAKDAPWFGHTRSCDDVGVILGGCDANGKWWLETACESPQFIPVRGLTPDTGIGCIRDNETCPLGGICLLQRGFTPIAGTSSHRFTMALDKINRPVAAIDDTYTDSFLTDTLGSQSGQPTKPRMSDEFVLDVRMRLNGFELKPDAPYPGHARITIGFAGVHLPSKKAMFVEVVVYRDDWYDLCTPQENRGGAGVNTPCDPSNLYDRRSAWATGEQVWYTASTLNDVPTAMASAQPVLHPDGQWRAYQLPVSRLFRAYPWVAGVAPSDWSQVQLDGIYLGLEVFGRARVWLDLDGYRFARTSHWQP